MIAIKDMYLLKDNNSHVRKELSREEAIAYIKELTGNEFDIQEYLSVSSKDYNITVRKLA